MVHVVFRVTNVRYDSGMKTRLVLLVPVLALVAAACGDDDAGPVETPAPAPVPVVTTTAVPATTAAPVGTPGPVTATAPAQTSGPAATAAPPTAAPPTAAPPTAAPPTAAPPTAAPPTAAPPTTAPAAAEFSITAVSISPAGQHVVVQNVGGVAGNLTGFAICQAPSYHVFGDIELAPGESLAVSLGGSVFIPPPGAKTTSASIGTIGAGDGEIGLYARADFGNSSAIVDYVEWGSTGHTRSSVAAGAGIWNPGDFIDNTEGDSVFLFVSDPAADGASAWDFEVAG